jgi:hypothetical protein
VVPSGNATGFVPVQDALMDKVVDPDIGSDVVWVPTMGMVTVPVSSPSMVAVVSIVSLWFVEHPLHQNRGP